MTVRQLRLMLGLFFLVAGVGLLIFRFGFPDVAAKANDPTRLLLGGLLALILAGVNLAKWYAGLAWYEQRATPVRVPLQPDPTADRDEEPNPAFDFSKQTPANDERA